MKGCFVLENWSVVVSPDNNPYTPPELQKQCLHGEVYGHPRFGNGEAVTTSVITNIKNGCVHTHSGSVYCLGDPSQQYEARYWGAKRRLLKGDYP